MKIFFPDENDSLTFFENPKNVDETWFIFVPVNNSKNVIYLCCVYFYNKEYENGTVVDQIVRVDPRYFSKNKFDQFLNNTNLKQVYQILIELIKSSKNYVDLKRKFEQLLNDGVIKYEIVNPSDLDSYTELGDYTYTNLYNYEKATFEKIGENEIERIIEMTQKILPRDDKVSDEVLNE